MATTLDRDDIIAGLRELIAELRAVGEVAGIRLVGGAALSLRCFDRGTTQDLDSLHVCPGTDDAVASAAARVAQRHDWDPACLNFEVTTADALPMLGRAVEWDTIFDSDDIVIQVAPKEALLAMKLRANRPGRDTRDIRMLLSLCKIATRPGGSVGSGGAVHLADNRARHLVDQPFLGKSDQVDLQVHTIVITVLWAVVAIISLRKTISSHRQYVALAKEQN